MTTIRGRYETGIEPHALVKDGSGVFGSLWEQWSHNAARREATNLPRL